MDVVRYPPYFFRRNEIKISRNTRSRSENMSPRRHLSFNETCMNINIHIYISHITASLSDTFLFFPSNIRKCLVYHVSNILIIISLNVTVWQNFDAWKKKGQFPGIWSNRPALRRVNCVVWHPCGAHVRKLIKSSGVRKMKALPRFCTAYVNNFAW